MSPEATACPRPEFDRDARAPRRTRPDRERLPWGRLFATLLAIIMAGELTIMLVLSLAPPLAPGVEATVDAVALAVLCALPLRWFVIRPLHRRILAEGARVAASEAAFATQLESQQTHGQILRALDMADSEDEVVEAARRSLTILTPRFPAEILIADSSHAHLRRTAATTVDHGTGCRVESPASCIAVRQGQTLSFGSSEALDACPRLRGRAQGACSAVCVPISILGRSAGVLHVVGAEHDGPALVDEEHLRQLGAALGNRLGMVRALADSQTQASVDPLTGLLNRRSLEARIVLLERRRSRYAVVTLDLDHFKRLNDTHGHSTGDQALRLFARVLRATAGEADVIARLGGEEFVIVMPEHDRSAAAAMADAVRRDLLAALSGAALPQFSVSAGVADWSQGQTFEEVLGCADAALYRAKNSGRDRVAMAA